MAFLGTSPFSIAHACRGCCSQGATGSVPISLSGAARNASALAPPRDRCVVGMTTVATDRLSGQRVHDGAEDIGRNLPPFSVERIERVDARAVPDEAVVHGLD